MPDTKPLSRFERECVRRIADSYEPILAIHHTITTAAAGVFFTVAANQGLSVGDLARKRGVSLAQMSKLLKGLGAITRSCKQGLDLVERHRDMMDQRRCTIYLTEKGIALAYATSQRLRGEPSAAQGLPTATAHGIAFQTPAEAAE